MPKVLRAFESSKNCFFYISLPSPFRICDPALPSTQLRHDNVFFVIVAAVLDVRIILKASRLQVLIQIGFKGEKFVTSAALVILVERVSLHVRPQVASVGKRLSTVTATVRLLASMRTQMALQ